MGDLKTAGRAGKPVSFLCQGGCFPAGVRATPNTTCQTHSLERDTRLHNLSSHPTWAED